MSSSIVSWMFSLMGPFALVVLPQWLAMKALKEDGLPKSLKGARIKLSRLLLDACILIDSKVEGKGEIALREIVGEEIPATVRIQNQCRLKAYYLFLDGQLMLPLIYRVESSISLSLIFFIAQYVTSIDYGQPGIQYAHNLILALLTVLCAIICVMVVIAYFRVVDVLAIIGDKESAEES